MGYAPAYQLLQYICRASPSALWIFYGFCVTDVMPFKFALLACYAVEQKTDSEEGHGFLPQLFIELLEKSSACALEDFTLDSYDVVTKQEYPTLSQENEYDAIIVSGSTISILGQDPWIKRLVRYVRRVASEKPDVKLFGICFGHQIITLALGGTCASMNGRWEIGPTRVKLTQLGKQLFKSEDLIINHTHRNQVVIAPLSFHLLGSTPVCPNQGMVRFRPNTYGRGLEAVQILTVQGHPEFHSDFMQFVIQVHESDSSDKHTVRVAKSRLKEGWRYDGVTVIGRAIWGTLGVC